MLYATKLSGRVYIYIMYKRSCLSFFIIVAGFMIMAPACFAGEPYSGFIRAQGRILADETGREFRIRGIGLGNWLLPEGYMWRFDGPRADRPRRIEETFASLLGTEKADAFWKEFRDVYISEKDIADIGAAGFNTVRLPLNWRLLMEDSPNSDSSGCVFREDGFAYIDKLVRWCKAYRVYIVLDLHAAPGGQTGRNIDDSENDRPDLFTTPRRRDMTILLWKEIARRYRSETIVLAYDLLNEPLPADTAKQYTPLLEPLYKDLSRG